MTAKCFQTSCCTLSAWKLVAQLVSRMKISEKIVLMMMFMVSPNVDFIRAGLWPAADARIGVCPAGE